LSANHIGQEATDLAALQAQLAQALLTHQLSLPPHHSHASFVHGVSVNIGRRDPTNVQHCTTPTARTPSSATFTWPLPVPELADHSRRRSASFARRQSIDNGWCDFEEMDEERIVEDMITPDSPRSSNTYVWSTYQGDVHGATTQGSTSISASNMSSPSDSCTSSPFTSTDPFYLQELQSTQQPHSSFFNHVGIPSAHSPFMMGVPAWQR